MLLYSLKDIKSGMFGPVMMAQNDAHMCRTLVEAFDGSKETVARFPGDFELFQIAEYSLDSGGSNQQLRFVCSMQLVLDPNGSGGHA